MLEITKVQLGVQTHRYQAKKRKYPQVSNFLNKLNRKVHQSNIQKRD